MAYFKINNVDYSACVSSLKITKSANYNAQTNAAGDTVVDYINDKNKIEVGIIPLSDALLQSLLTAVNGFQVSITYRNQQDGAMKTIDCIIPETAVEYYTIRTGNVSAKAFNLTFSEL